MWDWMSPNYSCKDHVGSCLRFILELQRQKLASVFTKNNVSFTYPGSQEISIYARKCEENVPAQVQCSYVPCSKCSRISSIDINRYVYIYIYVIYIYMVD